MADVIPDASLVNLLAGALGVNAPLNVRCFKNDLAGSVTTTLGSIVEANFSGYAPITIVPAVAVSLTEDGAAETQEFDLNFSHSGGSNSNSLYGYYVTSDGLAGQQLMWISRDDVAPIPMASAGDVYEVMIEVTATQEI